MHANVYSFWGQVEPRTEPSRQQRGRKSRERERGGESKREQITARVSSYSFCCGPTQLKHERILNQHDSGGKVKKKKKREIMQAMLKLAEARTLLCFKGLP